jgi:hypothetical protein
MWVSIYRARDKVYWRETSDRSVYLLDAFLDGNQNKKALTPAMNPAIAVTMAENRPRPAPAPMAELEDEELPELPDAPVAWAEPGAPDESVTAALEPGHYVKCKELCIDHMRRRT